MTFGEKYASRARVIMQALCAIKHINVVDPAIGQEMLLCMTPASTVSTCNAPGNAQAGQGIYQRYITSD